VGHFRQGTPRAGDSSLLRLRGNNAFGIQVLGNLLETVSTSVRFKDSSNDGQFVLAYFVSYAANDLAATLINPRCILDGHVTVSKVLLLAYQVFGAFAP